MSAKEPAQAVALHRFRLTQEGVVSLIALTLFVAFALFLNNFLTQGNLLTLLKNVAILGTLAVGMGFVVVGRGIDLTMVAVMVVGVAFAIWLTSQGFGFGQAVLIGAVLVACCGLITGILIAIAEVPPIFATLAMASIVYGGGRVAFSSDVLYAPGGIGWLMAIGSGTFLGIPYSILILAGIAALIALFLSLTRFGRFIYATGDNPHAARTMGLPTRPVQISQYVVAALIAYAAGILMTGLVSGINTRLYNSTLIYDVLLVVVLGGISLSGGQGGVRNVLVGTVLVGILINGMTIMNFSYTSQNLIKSVILLAALALDAVINPRDEQTSQSGDI
ncbi:ABC transporter permease [Aquamicrobium sp. NLF2-7]|jgi:ribose transport system permease protein|uniref:Ribose transport system permease protein n=1 Tax=Aquamicrobium lusatiense TaxID=89772 RepID=A0A7W9VWN9_9HYPH|nr:MULTISPECIES: ABC transporter permease [Aquamicrobium]MBB6013936.1 ribose transport system permease protein [Aquamicrobium lusatiense]MCG8273537.1 ABC transporter permease [Aquamicrobium sp. NLF2-7]MCK9553186.1 ABC transporter permease [Aquamicrobium sp.]